MSTPSPPHPRACSCSQSCRSDGRTDGPSPARTTLGALGSRRPRRGGGRCPGRGAGWPPSSAGQRDGRGGAQGGPRLPWPGRGWGVSPTTLSHGTSPTRRDSLLPTALRRKSGPWVTRCLACRPPLCSGIPHKSQGQPLLLGRSRPAPRGGEPGKGGWFPKKALTCSGHGRQREEQKLAGVTPSRWGPRRAQGGPHRVPGDTVLPLWGVGVKGSEAQRPPQGAGGTPQPHSPTPPGCTQAQEQAASKPPPPGPWGATPSRQCGPGRGLARSRGGIPLRGSCGFAQPARSLPASQVLQGPASRKVNAVGGRAGGPGAPASGHSGTLGTSLRAAAPQPSSRGPPPSSPGPVPSAPASPRVSCGRGSTGAPPSGGGGGARGRRPALPPPTQGRRDTEAGAVGGCPPPPWCPARPGWVSPPAARLSRPSTSHEAAGPAGGWDTLARRALPTATLQDTPPARPPHEDGARGGGGRGTASAARAPPSPAPLLPRLGGPRAGQAEGCQAEVVSGMPGSCPRGGMVQPRDQRPRRKGDKGTHVLTGIVGPGQPPRTGDSLWGSLWPEHPRSLGQAS